MGNKKWQGFTALIMHIQNFITLQSETKLVYHQGNTEYKGEHIISVTYE